MLSKILQWKLPRLLKHLAIIGELRAVENESFEGYFDVIVPHKERDGRDWKALHEVDAKRDMYQGIISLPEYHNRKEYKEKVRLDFNRMRDEIRKRLIRGILALGHSCYDRKSMRELMDRLGEKRSLACTPMNVARAVRLLPIIHQTTRDIGTSAGIHYVKMEAKIPVILLTSAFSQTLLLISQLIVRRTFLCTSSDSLELRSDRYLVDQLQRHARMLFYLLGIWIVGEPYPTPQIDDETRDLVYKLGSPDLIAEGHAIAWVKTGWSLFEALHEFSHVLTGDWLRPMDEWVAESEFVADRFAASCLLLDEDPVAKAWMLRGAHLFLLLLSLVEGFWGNTGLHPKANERAKQLYVFVRQQLTPDELLLFDLLDEMEALPAFCGVPSLYGANYGDRFGG